jgi:hypothetical protein
MRDQRPRDTFGPNDVGSKGEVQGNSVSHRDGAQGKTATPFPSFVPCCCCGQRKKNNNNKKTLLEKIDQCGEATPTGKA